MRAVQAGSAESGILEVCEYQLRHGEAGAEDDGPVEVGRRQFKQTGTRLLTVFGKPARLAAMISDFNE